MDEKKRDEVVKLLLSNGYKIDGNVVKCRHVPRRSTDAELDAMGYLIDHCGYQGEE